MRGTLRLSIPAVVLSALILVSSIFVTPGWTQAPTPKQSSEAAITQYCGGCHNARLKTAGVILDSATLAQIGEHAETLERAVRQLRAKTMPPAGMPRPDPAAYDRIASYLESE